MTRRRVIISGLVQGVYFRDSCRREALAHRVHGWVRNRPDGTVEAVFEGEPADVKHMVAWSATGPPRASVSRVDVTPEQPEHLTGFHVKA